MILSRAVLLLVLSLLGYVSAQCYEQPGGGDRRPVVRIKDMEGGVVRTRPENKRPTPEHKKSSQGGGGGGRGGGGGGGSGGRGSGGGGRQGGGSNPAEGGSPPPNTKDKDVGPGTDLGRIKATMTVYGSKDQNGSGNCVKKQACGTYASAGFSAAVSQNIYGVGAGQGTGPACGTCWNVTAEQDSSKNPLPGGPKTITIVVDNLCPPGGNPICAMPDLKSTNQYGANANFDLCQDSGAQEAIFGSGGNIGLGIGFAERVDCRLWQGKIDGQAWN